MGSITSWVRLEPRCRDDDLRQGVHARLYDPLWMLARQWQTGEFQGEDSATPVLARWRADSAPITRYFAGAIAPNTRLSAPRYSTGDMPLEALVERQPVPTGQDSSLRLAVESGLHFLRLLDAQPTSRGYRQAFLARFALQPPSAAERPGLDAETLSYWTLMAQRALDARRLVTAFRDDQGRRRPLPGDLGVLPADRAEVERAVDDWLAQHEALFDRPPSGAPGSGAPGSGAPAGPGAWDAERLEYAFSIAGAPGGEETPLTATQYAEGHLDWHSVDLDLEINLGATQDNASAGLVRTMIPAPVSFRGAPARRFWELEDSAIDYGLLPAGPGDLPQLLLSEFATSFGDDWYVLPIDLDVGTLTRTRSLVVTDSFGVQTLLPPVNGPSRPATGWSMFELSPVQRDGQPAGAGPRRPESNLFFLAPSLLRTLDGRPLEEVLFLRDEMANVAWAVEHVVQGPIEQRLEPGAAPDPPQTEVPTPIALPRYRLATEVPPGWTPLLPQRLPDASLRLVRAALLAPDGSNLIRRARGELLNTAPRLALYDEEIPREGVRVTRQFERTRWLGGSTLLWIGLRKRVGRGEGSSALRFDQAEQTEQAGE